MLRRSKINPRPKNIRKILALNGMSKNTRRLRKIKGKIRKEITELKTIPRIIPSRTNIFLFIALIISIL
jgi:hypothetical protein